MKRYIMILSLLIQAAVVAVAAVPASDTTSAAPAKSAYDKIADKQTARCDGMFTLILSDGKVYFAIPDSLLGREFLMGSTICSTSDNANGIVGSKSYNGLQHITFTMRDSTLLLREVESEYISSEEGIADAIAKSNIGPIKKAFKLAARTPEGGCLYDVTTVFLEHDKSMSPFLDNAAFAQYDRSENFKKDLSYINGIKAGEDNISVTSTMSYTYSMTESRTGTALYKDQPLTAVLTRSILLLPREVYTPRPGDYRIGYFHSERTQLGSVMKSSSDVYYTNRWRLEPSDVEAYNRGELVEPVKPIVFYIDPDFPDWWKPYIKDAVETWQSAFELCGFKNAIVARDFPTDDPSFDPDNIKYSCIRYAPIGIQNASGPSWVDPRSGEIITASVYVYHDVIKLLSRWMFVQTAQTDERMRTSYISQEVLGDALRYVLSHEVGHCLGLMHNMSASSVIPVDSLRSATFTRKYGTTTSIMDYARFNYVAQPGDMQRGVRMMPPRLGIYDKYAIRWGYTYGDVSGWITDSLKAAPYYRYGKQQMYSSLYDPSCQSEDLGDDVVKATQYGVKNLKYITANLMDWAGDDDPEYKVRLDYYNGILNQYLTYSQHVLLNVGGLYKYEVKAEDNRPAFENIPRKKQLAALDYMFELQEDLSWIAPDSVISRLPIVGSPERAVRKSVQNLILMAPFFASKSDGVVTKELSSSEIFDILFDEVWGPAKKGRKLTEAQRDFQKLYVSSYLESAGYSASVGGSASFAAAGCSDCYGCTCCSGCGCCSDCGSHMLFGELGYSPVDGYEWMPRSIFNTGDVTQGTIYVQLMRVYNVIKDRTESGNATDRAHYAILAATIEKALGL